MTAETLIWTLEGVVAITLGLTLYCYYKWKAAEQELATLQKQTGLEILKTAIALVKLAEYVRSSTKDLV